MISEQRERWLAEGSPPVPTLVVDGVRHVLQHPAQVGVILGLESPPALRNAWQVAWDVDALVGISALTNALSSGWFHWPGNPVTGELGDAMVVAYEASIVAGIHERGELLAFARPVAAAWRHAIHEHDDVLRAEPDRIVGAPRGEITLVELLEAQRLHAAQHYRQATTTLAGRGHPVPELDLAALYGLRLPDAIF